MPRLLCALVVAECSNCRHHPATVVGGCMQTSPRHLRCFNLMGGPSPYRIQVRLSGTNCYASGATFTYRWAAAFTGTLPSSSSCSSAGTASCTAVSEVHHRHGRRCPECQAKGTVEEYGRLQAFTAPGWVTRPPCPSQWILLPPRHGVTSWTAPRRRVVPCVVKAARRGNRGREVHCCWTVAKAAPRAPARLYINSGESHE